MKFELEPNSRGITKEQVLADIASVAETLGLGSLTMLQYEKHGRYTSSLARQRCGSWLQAIAEAGLSVKRKNSKVSSDEFIPDLKRVAEVLGKSSVTREEYRDHGRFGPGVVARHFGGWLEALQAAGLEKTREYGLSDAEYFRNLETMWVRLGRQPHYNDVRKPFSKYSAGAYERRFGTWRKALESFIAFVNEDKPMSEPPEDHIQEQDDGPSRCPIEAKSTLPKKPSRAISWRSRFLVMRRDNFKCRICGRSPAMHPGLVLHVDHVQAWSKDGPTTMENLQTLCEQDNIGKSNLSMKEEEDG